MWKCTTDCCHVCHFNLKGDMSKLGWQVVSAISRQWLPRLTQSRYQTLKWSIKHIPEMTFVQIRQWILRCSAICAVHKETLFDALHYSWNKIRIMHVITFPDKMHNYISCINTIFKVQFMWDSKTFQIMLMAFFFFVSYTYLSEILCGELLNLYQLHLKRKLSVGQLGMFFWGAAIALGPSPTCFGVTLWCQKFCHLWLLNQQLPG